MEWLADSVFWASQAEARKLLIERQFRLEQKMVKPIQRVASAYGQSWLSLKGCYGT